MSKDSTLDKEHKVATIQKEIEEATTLELPMLSKNLIKAELTQFLLVAINFHQILGLVLSKKYSISHLK